ncbi:UNVERIFIED_CONTAM: hypothetical protein FKN15_050889 [Acipenser sinensis]
MCSRATHNQTLCDYDTQYLRIPGAGASKVWLNAIDGINSYEGGSVSVQCRYDRYFNTNVKYWCRGKVWSSCKVIQRSHEKQREEDKVSISDNRTQGVFTVTVRRLEKKDADWYWCGIERVGIDEGTLLNLKVADGAGASKVWLNAIDGINSYEGGSVSVQCRYDRYFNTNVKYWCRGKVWSSCKVIQRSHEKQREEDKVSISDNRTQGVFTVTVRRLEKKDADWYWCGIERVGIDEGTLLNLKVADAGGSRARAPATETLVLAPVTPVLEQATPDVQLAVAMLAVTMLTVVRGTPALAPAFFLML